jgi:hypothetical protein
MFPCMQSLTKATSAISIASVDRPGVLARGRTHDHAALLTIWLSTLSFVDLSSNSLKVLSKLAGGGDGEHKPSAHHSASLWRITPSGPINSNVCKRYGNIPMYGGNSYHFGCKYLPLMKRVFQDQLRGICHN